MANKVTFKSKEFKQPTEADPNIEPHWSLNVDIQIGADTRTGPHVSCLPADATDAELEKDILAQYGAA